ncbi:hydroxylamine reductase [Methylotuvimicrobium buryatense]|uniref:Hydroxylamine reductase n=1 Tax=Methylotuvimicrobium buryatense TaxID=95641 RepID=A0A4V1IJG6_METBY|nr:hydroxylamine reductase [Methylotuvimicrobium buryatense]QCW81335.1 hydroxylamine reductase [Methylotuvimicrobium buryatense]
MFCYQCEQTTRSETGSGCQEVKGVCGKDETTADLQDLMIYGLQGIAQYATRLRKLGEAQPKADEFMLYALFTTLTNVNFNANRFAQLIKETAQWRDQLKSHYQELAAQQGEAVEDLGGPAQWQPAGTMPGLLIQAKEAAINVELAQVGEDIIGLRAMLLYGIKGAAAYAYHALMLGYRDDDIYAGFEQALEFLATHPTDADALLAWALRIGELNYRVMAMLDAANTGSFGAQQPGTVNLAPVKGKAILVSGHDLHDLAQLLEQTQGLGINVYTHGEMLPAHAYPKLKAYPHLSGNYGSAWQNQHNDFTAFPGPILMTSNCLVEPAHAYRQRIFTAGPVGWPGVRHIQNGDFAPVIAAAHALPGFTKDEPEHLINVGFGRDAVMGVADKVIDAVKTGAIQHFFLIGGCDGAAPGRNYFTEVAEQAPDDSVILTLGCGKYRFNSHDFGAIGGIPRLLDMGQCNDAYSAIQVASALAKAFDCGVNDLPLSMMISWFEQKAVAVLLTLLALGIRGIRLGPTLPAFLTPALLAKLSEAFDLKATGTATDDIRDALQKAA